MVSIRTVFGSFLDFLYPPTCLACGQLLAEGGRHICAACWSRVVFARDHPDLAAEASAKIGPAVDAVISAFVFQKTGPLQALVHAVKYQNADRVGIWLGERMGEVVASMLPVVDLVVPVPLHRVKERERGYNQAEMIARGLAARLGVAVGPGYLRRVRHTSTQTKLSIEQRRSNVSEAFQIDPGCAGRLEGSTIVLVDDVITTGATVGACARALRDAGAGRVIAASVALADHDA